MEEDFRAALLTDTALRSLVPPAGINWGEQPQGGGVPYVVLYLIGGADSMTMQGPDGLSEGRVQVDCYARGYAECKRLSRAIVARMNGYRTTRLRLVQHVGTRDDREGGSNEAERLFRVSLDFTTSWRA